MVKGEPVIPATFVLVSEGETETMLSRFPDASALLSLKLHRGRNLKHSPQEGYILFFFFFTGLSSFSVIVLYFFILSTMSKFPKNNAKQVFSQIFAIREKLIYHMNGRVTHVHACLKTFK